MIGIVFLHKTTTHMKFTFYGHSCFSVEIKGKHILFDPFISPNELAKDIDVDGLKVDYILISHGHIDHLADAERLALRTGATIVSNFEIVSWFQNKGFSKGHPMNHGGAWNFDFGKVKFVNAVHSSVLPDGAYGGNPGGFVVESEEGNFYYAGDTALTMDMQLIAKQHQLDYCVFPIGDNFTMGVEDAIMAADFVGCSKVVGVHYDTFPPIEIDKAKAVEQFKSGNKELILFSIGETKEL